MDDTATHPVAQLYDTKSLGQVGSYLGVPIVLGDGTMFGTLCAIDPEPHAFTERELGAMKHLAQFLGHALELQKLASRFRLQSAALESTANAVAITDRDGRIQWVNPAFTRMTGFTLEEAVQQNIAEIAEHIQLLMEEQYWESESASHRKDGSLYYQETKITPVHDETGEITHFIAVRQDVTARKQAEAKLHDLAHFDPLTRLPNRVQFRKRLTAEIEKAQWNSQTLALLFLDLDRFKTINDTLGHTVGDQLLKAVAERLRFCVRPQDIVSRITGDGFTVILPDVSGAAEVETIAARVVEGIAEPYTVDGYDLFISTSVGVTIYPEHGGDAETLLRLADTAMDFAKESGRNNYRFYTESMSTDSKLEMETALRRAVEREELSLHYQPKVDLETGEINGMEALLRWYNPTFGFVPPDQFIPLAEEIGLIGKLGEWVMRTACAQNRSWQDLGLPPLRVAVNLSVGQFQYTNLVETVRSVLRETGLDGQWLELEVTESLIIQDTELIIDTLLSLKELGIEISIDDFGTGYSSLRYLQRLPVDSLKIDRSFIKDLGSPRKDDSAIPRAIILMAHSLGLKVIAEGVETEEQLRFLRHEKCDSMQGYLFSRPVPAKQFEEALREGKRLEM
ncbi:hypothetical protein EL26_05830 [Tumebacillus flagellatus]|uniref:Diguanylate cyclase n=2 Tax=Tumebacillus flagellatus TaxID=1157490 RepID=A0A074LUK5_9BACL|nr:hypothetical protein EL26_05830 [Tumebacillus flagellatus]